MTDYVLRDDDEDRHGGSDRQAESEMDDKVWARQECPRPRQRTLEQLELPGISQSGRERAANDVAVTPEQVNRTNDGGQRDQRKHNPGGEKQDGVRRQKPGGAL